MTRVPGSRNFRFDRVFPEPVGRITSSAGTSSRKEYHDRDRILTRLADDAQLGVLLAFKRGEVSIEELVEADRQGRLRGSAILADVKLRQPMTAAIAALLPEKPPIGTARRGYWQSLRDLCTLAPPYRIGIGKFDASATVGDLERVDWEGLKAWWLAPKALGGRGRSAANWMHLRRAVSWLLTQLLGDVLHPTRRAIVKRIPTVEEVEREVNLTPEEFWAIVDRVRPAVADALVTLVASGMRLGEFERCTVFHLAPKSYRITVPGRKTTGSRASVGIAPDYWPYVERAIPPKRRRLAIQRAFRRAARKIGHPELHLHDLRHCFIAWGLAEGATIPQAQRAARHADPRMTLRYAVQRESGAMGDAVGRALNKGRKPA